MWIIVLCVLIFALCILWIIYQTRAMEEFDEKNTPIYCIMVTGKSKCRTDLAQKSLDNFFEQSYQNKKLIVINHGKDKIIKDPIPNVFEHQIEKNETLGDIRNISLNLVPINACWITWDDDDYRSPQYLSYLFSIMKSSNCDVVAITERYEYNYNTGLVWKMTFKNGFVHILAKQDLRIRYESKDSMEDINLINDFRKLGKKVHVVERNDPSLYIRVVHTDNTSEYVNKNKTNVRDIDPRTSMYPENKVDEQKAKEIRDFMYDYYKTGLQCMLNS